MDLYGRTPARSQPEWRSPPPDTGLEGLPFLSPSLTLLNVDARLGVCLFFLDSDLGFSFCWFRLHVAFDGQRRRRRPRALPRATRRRQLRLLHADRLLWIW